MSPSLIAWRISMRTTPWMFLPFQLVEFMACGSRKDRPIPNRLSEAQASPIFVSLVANRAARKSAFSENLACSASRRIRGASADHVSVLKPLRCRASSCQLGWSCSVFRQLSRWRQIEVPSDGLSTVLQRYITDHQ